MTGRPKPGEADYWQARRERAERPRELIEVDRDYLWALEVVACQKVRRLDDPGMETFSEAMDVVQSANLSRPIDRYPGGDDAT